MNGRIHFNLWLPREIHGRLRIAAAATGKTITSYIVAAVVEKILREIDNEKADTLRREIQP